MNLLIIDNSLNSLLLFESAINVNTKYITYDYTTETLTDLTTKISNLGESSYSNLAFVFSFNNTYTQQLALNENFITLDISNNIISNNVINFISNLVTTYSISTIDFLACNLLNNSYWNNYLVYLGNTLSILIRASDDLTGNLKDGGDWILETTNDDIRLLYFSNGIQYWNNLLDVQPTQFSNMIIDNQGYIWYCGNNQGGQFGTGDFNPPFSYYAFIKNTSFIDLSIEPTGFIPVTDILCTDNFAWILTGELTNNFYVCGINYSGMTFKNRTKFSNRLADDTTPIFPGKKVIGFSLATNNSSNSGYGTLITDEATNNLYVLGNYWDKLDSNSPSVLQTYTTPTVCSGALSGKRVLKSSASGDSNDLNRSYILAITDEATNNLYGHGRNANFCLGLGTDLGYYAWTNITTSDVSLIGKTIQAVRGAQSCTFILTNDLSDNLWVVGYNQYGQLGQNNTNVIPSFTNIFSGNPFVGKKVMYIDVFFSGWALTDELTNNLYSTGLNLQFSMGRPTSYVFSNVYTNDTRTFGVNWIPFTGKKITYLKVGPQFSWCLTSDTTNNYFSVGTGYNGAGTGRTDGAPDGTTINYLTAWSNTLINS